MSKIRRFDINRLENEVDWFGQMKIGMVFCADANFGIFARDLDLAERLNTAYRAYGYPQQVNYSAAKNDPERVVAIALKFVETGICSNHMFAIQHTRQEVLEATDRSNISTDKQVQVVKSLMANGVPITVQLILGIPGDTLELWKGGMADLMELGVHDDYETYFYSLLPNAPAAEPAFMKHWEVETIDRYIFTGAKPLWKPAELDVRSNRSRLVVQTKTFSREDWLKMFTFTVMVKALHNASVTRLIAMYLRLTHGVSYLTFYESVIEDFFATNPLTRAWYDEVMTCYRNFLEHEDARDRIMLADLPIFQYALEPSRWIDVQVCRNLDRVFEALKTHLLARFPDVPHLASVIDYQRELIIVPTYDRRLGKTFVTDFDWPGYFAEATARAGSEFLDEPEFLPGSAVEVSDQTCGEKGWLVRPLDWKVDGGDERWVAWIDAIQQRNSAAKRNFQMLRLVAPGRAYASLQ
jgi:putative methyltransferase